jgi:pSer/pThr/pTyr-binding forkhead associated (FHA) protein
VKTYGELIPIGGGDSIPLLKTTLIVGRRESSDIVLRFPNVSGKHCELMFEEGFWTARDLGSANGTKVNGFRVSESQLLPGDKVGFSKHVYEIRYEQNQFEQSAKEKSPQKNIFEKSLLESAGLENRRPTKPPDHMRLTG